ncbi:tetratricopeptide repeat protein [Pontibacter sp. BT310]|uniref:Tetratricopeptide repeat protein n=1 Tax=Pontibacter populi TaxID=890055 RepID=A0ABS6X8X1_9BACT|nr:MULTISPECIES: tetratricopeptide repeat protein [Pontibacter]MBJ6117581.1 tetratricopeptide repeat protein [Pontibacter sp. BT310]MBR0570006.1 tetratricopeptide repeat protein [Microvirga sp. STS03]MBW3364433.1 tetratricopeptide repeat protein [Pontibacter populi]
MALLKKTYLLLALCLTIAATIAQAQTQNLELAREYFSKGEYQKAAELYEKLVEDKRLFSVTYPDYLKTLLALRNYKEAEKLVKRTIKQNPGNYNFEVDLGMVYQAAGDKAGAEKHFNKLIQQMNPEATVVVASAFIQNELYDYAEKAYLRGRELTKNPLENNRPLIALYSYRQKNEALIPEVLNLLQENESEVGYVQNMLQNSVRDEKAQDALEKELIMRVQQNPDKLGYSELLIWLYVQRLDFYGALMQARAVDKRTRSGGSRVMELGAISAQNKDYNSAIEAYEYIIKEYPEGPYYLVARQRLINAREEQVQNTFPVDQEKIRALIADYDALLTEVGRSAATAEVLQHMANLYAFYLDDKAKAIELLQEAIAMPRANANLVAESKLTLGDIYVLKGEPWEATLLYSQVEKSHKDTPIGYDAKLRNARLSYYKGDFELAQAHLDILKLATSREIANDAMDLSLLITDNTGLDTSTTAMEEYAAIELLVFQNKLQQALTKLDGMLKKYPGHSLTDEIYFQKAAIQERMGNFTEAVASLQHIVGNPQYDILSDDALFRMAYIYEENLKDPAKAQQLYNDLLKKHQGSIFVAEARKRFRKLRGDTVN